MDAGMRKIRKFIYDRFRETSRPPVVEEVMNRFNLCRPQAVESLNILESERHIVLLPGTERILMAHPFSAATTPYRVKLTGGQLMFGNCALDSISLHVALKQDVRIESFCHHSGKPIEVDLENETVRSVRPEGTIVYFGLPVARWWDDIIHTCSNTMVFFGSQRDLDEWLTSNRIKARGQDLTIEKTIKLSLPTSRRRMEIDYDKPSIPELTNHFRSLDLQGPFWQL